MDIDGAAAVRGKQQGAVFAAINGNGDVFHGEGLSIKEGIEPMEDEGAQGEADQHGGEDVFHAVTALALRVARIPALSCCKY